MDLREEAARRLDLIIDYVRTGPNASFRAHLDEGAAYEYGGELLKRTGKQRWFNNPCPWVDGGRLLAHMDWFSFEAAHICQRGVDRELAVRKPERGEPAPFRLIVEHVTPVRVLREAIRADSGVWQRGTLTEFLHFHYKQAVITQTENAMLKPFNHSMPHEWRPG